MLTLTALNGSIVCTDCCWGPWTFNNIFEHLEIHGVRTLIYGKFHTQVPQNICINWRTWSLGFVNPCTFTATLPNSV